MLTVSSGVPLAPLTTIGVGGRAEALAVARSVLDVVAAVELANRRHERRLTVLGCGSNVVISDNGVAGLALTMRGGAPTVIRRTAAGWVVDVNAGMQWDAFVAWSVQRGLFGVELLSGIPGTVGASPVQNVSAYGQEVSTVVRRVTVVDRKDGSVREVTAAECGFGHRSSRFKVEWRDRYVIGSVRFHLPVRPILEQLTHPDLQRAFRGRADADQLTARRAAVLGVRAAKSMVLDPADPWSRSVGSFFIAPELDRRTALAILTQVRGPELAGQFEAGWGSLAKVRIPAPFLLLAAGFAAGDSWGRVGLSKRHVLVLVNRGGARAADVWDVAHHIRDLVTARLGIRTEFEPQFLGDFPLPRPVGPATRAAAGTEPEWTVAGTSR